MTTDEREAVQNRVELLHRLWRKHLDFLPPPAVGKPDELDPAVSETIPKGLECRDVPILTRQAAGIETGSS